VPAKYDINHIGDRGIGNGANKYSLEGERKLGQALAKDMDSSSKLVTDRVITEYVNRLGQRIVGSSDAQVPFTIRVIESDEINAFTLPGGYLYVDTGLILAADNEAELAGVLAHEVAHMARHFGEPPIFRIPEPSLQSNRSLSFLTRYEDQRVVDEKVQVEAGDLPSTTFRRPRQISKIETFAHQACLLCITTHPTRLTLWCGVCTLLSDASGDA